MAQPQVSNVCKYTVAQSGGLWRVARDEADKASFAGLAEATEFACALARDNARCGLVSAVVVTAEVYELHCFTPDRATDLAATRRDLVPAARSW